MEIIQIAILTESIVEYTKSVINAFNEKDYKTVLTQAIAVFIAVAICVMLKADMLGICGISADNNIVCYVITGIICARGANYASDILKRIQGGGDGWPW